MLTYNTQLKSLELPEYGRNVHKLIEHCLGIADREKRTQCAYGIVDVMATLFPQLRSEEDHNKKLWDHLMIMSRFELDVDFPCEVISKADISSAPEAVGYGRNNTQRRHYGATVQRMLLHAAAMPEGEERQELVMMLANQMKKTLLVNNPDSADDAKVFHDILEMTNGAIRFDPDKCSLRQYNIQAKASGKKRKKNK